MEDVDLLPEESVVWSGSPVRSQLWRPADPLLTLAALVWLGLAVGWVLLVLPSPLALAGVPFVLAGLWLAGGRFVTRLRRPRYVLTNVRLLVAGRSHYLRALPPPALAHDTVAFGDLPGVRDTLRTRNPWAAEPGRYPVLWNLSDAAHVRDLVSTHREARFDIN